MLDIGAAAALDTALLEGWRSRIERARAHLGWDLKRSVVRRHATGASLAIPAPPDRLFLAAEINEWALCASLSAERGVPPQALEFALLAAWREAHEDPADPATPFVPTLDESAAFARFGSLAALADVQNLRPLLNAAATRGLSHLLDDADLTLGTGAGSCSYPLCGLPASADVPWDTVHDIPTAIVTGSNGKTTTVRLLAACARAHGWRSGYNCTDGVFVGDEQVAAGDYSGPAGARLVLRDLRSQAAILETARGGILRRGIAVSRADVAVITNVSSDHFGEYGIDDLEGLADVKLTVASVVSPDGLLVLNADDALLVSKSQHLERRFGRVPPLAWFARDWDHPVLRGHRSTGAPTCGVSGDRLCLSRQGAEHDLGRVADLPLSIGGNAAYNVANLSGAALAAVALKIDPSTVAAVFARFGQNPEDNPGRLMSFAVGGFRVLLDYAHNPDGLRGFLTVAEHFRQGRGRLGILLGQAGNRKDADIEAVAQVAAEFRPALVVVKENETQLRGRAPGEVPRILRAELLRQQVPDSAIPLCDSELDAVRYALDWAEPGDVLALPVHSAGARAAVIALLALNRREI